jgi:hypothetical protein
LKKTGKEYKIINGQWDELRDTLIAAVFDGGTDFSRIKLGGIAGKEVLFFSDGISTLSDADFLRNDKSKTKRPIHCVVSSAKADYGAMRLIALKTKGKFINANELSPEKLKDELLSETPLFLGVEHGKIIREVYPSIVTPVRGNFSAAGISGAKNAELTLLFGFGNKVEKRIKVKLDAKSAVEQGNAHKIWAQKKVAELDLDYEKNMAELTKIGRQFGVVTRGTSLIVLETVSDYKLYGIKLPPDLQEKEKNRADGATDTGWSVEGLTNSLKRSGGGGGVGAGFSGGRGLGPDIFGKGGFAADIDKILGGLGGLKSGGDGGRYIRGSNNAGYNYGFGGGGQTLNDLLEGSAGGNISGGPELKKSGEIKVSLPDFPTVTGGRDSAKVKSVIAQNIGALRYEYNKRSRENPGLQGKVTVKFSIDEFGKTVSADIAESAIKDAVFERTVVNWAKKLLFDKINKPGNMTEVICPLVFEGGYDWTPSVKKANAERERKTRDEMEKWEKEQEKREKEWEKNKARWELEELADMVIGRGMLIEAVEAAAQIRKWWNAGVTPKTRKYPAFEKNDETAPADLGEYVNDKVYFKGMTGETAGDYQLYLKRRADYAATPAFYFDMAHWFYTHGDKEAALRALTSIAELEFENAANYRMLGYRLKEYGEYATEKYVCSKVVQWRPMEPQNYRDYALALADNGETQAALDALRFLFTRPFTIGARSRSDGIEEVAVTEINRLLAKNPQLNASKINRRLLTNITADIRVVINWNTDNADINLSVKDPSGEWYRHGADTTGTGGRLSYDNMAGYGPEQFLLKKAAKGKYLICASYKSDSRVAATEPTAVMAEIYTKYAGKAETRRVVCLQMSNAKAMAARGDKIVTVAEFEF